MKMTKFEDWKSMSAKDDECMIWIRPWTDFAALCHMQEVILEYSNIVRFFPTDFALNLGNFEAQNSA